MYLKDCYICPRAESRICGARTNPRRLRTLTRRCDLMLSKANIRESVQWTFSVCSNKNCAVRFPRVLHIHGNAIQTKRSLSHERTDIKSVVIVYGKFNIMLQQVTDEQRTHKKEWEKNVCTSWWSEFIHVIKVQYFAFTCKCVYITTIYFEHNKYIKIPDFVRLWNPHMIYVIHQLKGAQLSTQFYSIVLYCHGAFSIHSPNHMQMCFILSCKNTCKSHFRIPTNCSTFYLMYIRTSVYTRAIFSMKWVVYVLMCNVCKCVWRMNRNVFASSKYRLRVKAHSAQCTGRMCMDQHTDRTLQDTQDDNDADAVDNSSCRCAFMLSLMDVHDAPNMRCKHVNDEAICCDDDDDDYTWVQQLECIIE